jgi:hypothetical protein
MKPTSPLKWSAVAFGIFWAGWMIWSSGPVNRGSAVIFSIGGIFVGYLWYRGMRWWFQRTGLLPRNEDPPSHPGIG